MSETTGTSIVVNEKKCSKCNETKGRDQFTLRPKSKDGLVVWCKPCVKEYNKTYNKTNAATLLPRKKDYYEGNKSHLLSKQAEYVRQRSQKDNGFVLARRLRTRLYQAVCGEFRSGSAVRDLGCSIEDLKKHLEAQFKPGMSWGNYGEWHIDHIKPLASFNLTDREQLLQACHYTNLQPLWAEENLKKGAA